jgi:hypothetical protein
MAYGRPWIDRQLRELASPRPRPAKPTFLGGQRVRAESIAIRATKSRKRLADLGCVNRSDRAPPSVTSPKQACLDAVFRDRALVELKAETGALRHGVMAVVELRTVGDKGVEERIAVGMKRFHISAMRD